jgi:hypothetical protein
MKARRDLALAGGAALAAGLLVGFMAERLRRVAPSAETGPIPVAGARDATRLAPMPRGDAPAGDVLERFRLAAAV